ncbi:MAG TPA: ferrous iron transport protein B [Prolixibacteraceae bacterium]|mgnify:CR=1 FL=1|nr:ferrous iron transport protein B [Prolixibacteraceae bacterium]HPR85290.1 ferrous iron transport protein B [Prolixibacteraceae bacterium]
MRLAEVKNKESVIITKVLGHGSFRKRITEMGFVKGKEVTVIKTAPFNGPIEFKILDYNITLRRTEANLIEVVSIDEASKYLTQDFEGVIDSENLKISAKEKERTINIALVGNPNCGKTTLFNFLSGSKEHVGNYSGVTVDAKKASFSSGDYFFNIFDLPGTYSLTAYSPEEIYVRNFIQDETPDIVINVIDASNLERNLFLTTQLIDMDIKVIIALNMFDELIKNGVKFDHQGLGKLIGIPIIPTISSKGKGLQELIDKTIEVYEDRDPIVRHIHINYGTEIEKSISTLRKKIKLEKPIIDTASSRFLAIKLLERDKQTAESLSTYPNFSEIEKTAQSEIKRIEGIYNEDSETVITDAKYGFISGALKETIRHRKKNTVNTSERIDNVLTNNILGFPIFILSISLAFFATFKIGAIPMKWIEDFVALFSQQISSALPDGMFKDLVVNGIIDGTGSVLVFLPNILILFFFISFMEDSGYMARAAFIMDKIMHRFGLHGRSFIPMVMGFGCNVPAIMATRTLRNSSDRILTMLIVPFMSCSARLPVYVLIITAFFPENPALVLSSIYFGGLLIAFLTAQLLSRTIFKNKETPFVLELPPYRLPTLKNISIHMWDKARQYLQKIGGVILIGVVIIWALGYFPRESQNAQPIRTAISTESATGQQQSQAKGGQLENSYLGQLGKFIQPVMAPLGFDWKMSISLLAGLPAKEIIVSTMGVLYQVDQDDNHHVGLSKKLVEEKYISGEKIGQKVFTTPVALAFLAFVLIYFPCLGVIATIRNESGKAKWAVFAIIYTTAVAWIAAFLVFQISTHFI